MTKHESTRWTNVVRIVIALAVACSILLGYAIGSPELEFVLGVGILCALLCGAYMVVLVLGVHLFALVHRYFSSYGREVDDDAGATAALEQEPDRKDDVQWLDIGGEGVPHKGPGEPY